MTTKIVLLLVVFVASIALGLPEGKYVLVEFSVEETPDCKADGRRWDVVDNIPDLLVQFVVDGVDVFISSVANNSTRHTWSVGEDVGFSNHSSIVIRIYDNDFSNHDIVDEASYALGDFGVGRNAFEMRNGTVIAFELANSEEQMRQIEHLAIEKSYSANYGGTGSAWNCNVSITGDYIGDANARIAVEVKDGYSVMGWWNGRVSENFLNQSTDDIEYYMQEPIYNVVVSDELLSLYAHPEHFDDFTGFAIGIKPATTIIAYDPVLCGYVELMSPSIIQEARQRQQMAATRNLLSACASIVSVSDPVLGTLLSAIVNSSN